MCDSLHNVSRELARRAGSPTSGGSFGRRGAINVVEAGDDGNIWICCANCIIEHWEAVLSIRFGSVVQAVFISDFDELDRERLWISETGANTAPWR
jgi:hypothetical protein